ncbi:MAG: BatA and WFA domain-containing protein [Crocinitomicaceae bacterium]
MSFVYPNFLWAYFLIAIPIVVHLFNFRRYKKVYFSRVKFLKEVTEDSRSGSKLKHLLILLSRILAILCLVTAFAQPFIPLDDSRNTENVTSIYIDNSYSMQAEGKDGNLLNEVKNKAIELVRSLDENEKINLLTADLLSIHQRFYSKSEVIEMIKEIDFSARSTHLSSALNLQLDLLTALEEDANKRIFLFSDFQQSSTGLSGWSRPEKPTFYYQAEPQQVGNIYIDSIWFLTPVHRINTPIDIHFRIRNSTDKEQADIPVSLSIDGSSPAPKRVNIPPHSFVDEKITFTDRTAGIKSGVLSISTSQLFFDDQFYFTYTIKNEVRILLAQHPDNKVVNIEQLYALDSYYDCTTTSIDALSQDDFKGKEFIIFQNIDKLPSGIIDLVNNSIKNGATVMMIPGNKLKTENWNQFMNQYKLPPFTTLDSVNSAVSYFNSNDPLYTGVFEGEPRDFKFPRLYAAYDLQIFNRANFITLFGITISRPFLYYTRQSNGRVIVMTSPLLPAYSDFQNHALFAATMLRFAETSSYENPLYMEIGEMYNYPLTQEIDDTHPIHLKKEEYAVDIIPQVINTNNNRYISFSQLEDQINRAGIYTLTNQSSFNEKLAINFNRDESDIELFSDGEIQENFESIGWTKTRKLTLNDTGTIQINQLNAKEYWRILLILALICIAAEILLLKLWKT